MKKKKPQVMVTEPQTRPSHGSSVEVGQIPSFTILRTDTVFAKLPIHSLTKSEPIEIRIHKNDDQGLHELYWSVSPSLIYGPPQLLAYKLDTLVINRHLDALKRPLPSLICLGSLRQIQEDLGQSRGKSTADLKRALHQNAAVYITAKLHYRDLQGKQRRLEAGFHRYGVVFTGESLPDGNTADAVYIILNETYHQVLNSAPTRPIDYDYLVDLKPLAQRFYELLSFRMYAALKYQHRQVSMRYSEFCEFAPQHRYTNGSQMSKQMYRVHQPHLRSGYLRDVTTQSMTDDQGRADWLLEYTPGPKAETEYQASTGSYRKDKPSLQLTAGAQEPANALCDGSEIASVEPLQAESRADPAMTVQGSGGRDLRVTAGTDESEATVCDASEAESVVPSPTTSRTDSASALVQQFYQDIHGVSDKTPHPKEMAHAKRLLAEHGPAFAAFFVVYACKTARQNDFQPDVFGGLLRYEVSALSTYQQGEAREARQRAEASAEQERRLLDTYDMWLRQRLNELKKALPTEQLQVLRVEAQQRVCATPDVPDFAQECQVGYEVDTHLMAAHGLPSFEVWCREQGPQHAATSQEGDLR